MPRSPDRRLAQPRHFRRLRSTKPTRTINTTATTIRTPATLPVPLASSRGRTKQKGSDHSDIVTSACSRTPVRPDTSGLEQYETRHTRTGSRQKR